jgi:hypothetical protein
MNTKIIIGTATMALVMLAIAPVLVNQASAKITIQERTTCEKPSGVTQERACPGASGTQGQSTEDQCNIATNPTGRGVPGQTTC